LTEEQFDNLTMILRGGEHQQIILTYNPIDQDHFTNKRFVECKKDRILETFEDGEPKVWEIDISEVIDGENVQYTVLVICSTYNDNKFISPVRKLTIEKLKDSNPFLYEVYRKGRYGTRGGRILENVEQIDFEQKGYRFENFDSKGYSQDFGYQHSDCILSCAERENSLYVFDEIYVNEMNTDEIMALAERKRISKRLTMICDCEDPNAINLWQRSGYNARGVKKYPGSVNAQIDRLKRYDKIYINVKCPNTYKESKSWMWKQNKNGQYIDEPVAIYDDAMAALRYSGDLFAEGSGGIDWAKLAQRSR
jgi:phage terminase large subunit